MTAVAAAVDRAVDATEACLKAAKVARCELLRCLRIVGQRLPSETKSREDPDHKPARHGR